MQNQPTKKSLLQRQIPTILGLTLLAVAMIAGIVLLGRNTGAFSPRAAPETTPQKIKITNITDSSFTVSFLTTERTAGFVRYGTEARKLSSQISDDRDQLSGSIGEYQTHHVTVRGLQPKTNYYFVLGTGNNAQFDNNGNPYEVETAQRKGNPSAAQTIYGTITTNSGQAADGAIVYASIGGVGQMSSLVKNSGSWTIPLSNARTADGSSYADISEEDDVSIFVQGNLSQPTSNFSTSVAEAQPVPSTVLGEAPSGASSTASTTGISSSATSSSTNNTATTSATPTQTEEVSVTLDPTAYQAPAVSNTPFAGSSTTNTASTSPSALEIFDSALGGTATGGASVASESATTVDFNKTGVQIVTTGQPKIKGTVLPNIIVALEVNSETQIQHQLVADENGEFVLDIESLSAQLEPGEHTATYTYADPTTGAPISRTVSFMVEGEPLGTGGTIAQAYPYSSSNPYTIGSSSATATGGATTSAIPTYSTRSAVASGSPVPVSGAVETTIALILGGAFFITAGVWSMWLAKEWAVVMDDE